MILISGSELSSEELPFGDMMEYVVENNPAILSIKLKTAARSSVCLGVYLHTDLQVDSIPDDVMEKVTYFSSDDELIGLLERGGRKEEEEDSAEGGSIPSVEDEVEEESFKVFSPPESQTQPLESAETYEVLTPENLEEADIEIADDLLTIPMASDDMDSLRWQIELKERMLAQKDGVIEELRKNMDDLLRLQEIQLLEMRTEYEKRVEDAQQIINNLQSQLENSSVPEEYQGFMHFAPYSRNYKAMLKEAITEEERAKLGKLNSMYYFFASGAGDSLHSMMKNVKSMIDKGTKALLVDFSNDYFLNGRLKIQTRDSSMLLGDPNFEVSKLVRTHNNVEIIPTTFYNDIALLTLDWVTIIKKLDLYASGRPVIFLFNNINSFSVRYTVSKLATIGQLYVFAKCSPIILSTLTGDLAFIPDNRLVIVALEFIDVVQTLLERISKKYSVVAFRDEVSWKELKIRV